MTVDGVDARIDGLWSAGNFYIYGVSLKGSGFPTGEIKGISMLGDSSGRRQQPWRALGSTKISQYSVAGTNLFFGPAQLAGGPMMPQSLLFVQSGKARLCISFQRFTSQNTGHYLGTIPTVALNGSARITKVTPRYVLQSGGTALTAATETPTISVGTSVGSGNLVPATTIASLSTISSPVDGTAANEVVETGSNIGLYMSITSGSLNSNGSAFLMLDIDYTITV